MLESLVEKLLNKFLAPYVEGIERNLHLGVWSGNIVLENLKLKPQITEILDLSFKIIHGNIGRINIQIPWSSLGKNPVCVLIKNVHIYVKPRSYKKSENIIIEELRRAKMHRLQLLEEEISIIKQQKNKEKSSEKSTLIFKLLNKIINNIQIDIQDILIHFEDPEKKFSIGFILKSSSVKNFQNKSDSSAGEVNNANSEHKKLNHIIDFKGLCIYSNSNIRKRRKRRLFTTRTTAEKEDKAAITKTTGESSEERKGATDGEEQVWSEGQNWNTENRGRTSGRPKSSCVSDTRDDDEKMETDMCTDKRNEKNDEKERSHQDKTNIRKDVSDKVEISNFSTKVSNDNSSVHISYKDNISFESKMSSDDYDNGDDYLKKTLFRISTFLKCDNNKILNYYNFEYLIKPFDLVLPVEQSSNKKELKARLEISEKWEGITLTRTQITKIIEIMNEANKSRKKTNKLLLKYACSVKLDIESLRSETKNEFMNLYNKVLGEEYNMSKIELTSSELNRLQILYDVVGVRHLAKWRLQCRSTLEKIIEEKNLKKKYLYDSIYKQQSWWSWVTGSKKDIENKVQNILKSEQDIINEQELYILQEAVTNEHNYDVVVPTKYDFQFKLANFSINVYDDCTKKRIHVHRERIVQNGGNTKIRENKCSENTEIFSKHADMAGNDEDVIENKDHNKRKRNFKGGKDADENVEDEISLTGSGDTLLNSTPDMSTANCDNIKRKMRYEEINILSINFYQIYSSLSLQSVVDHNDNDNFQWKFVIELQNFIAKHKDKIFMEFRNSKSVFPYNITSTGSIYQNPIYYSLLHSQSMCAYLEINHLVTEKGNTLSTLLRLNPLELYLSPLLIKNILSFTFPLLDILNHSQKSSVRKQRGKNSNVCAEKEEKAERGEVHTLAIDKVDSISIFLPDAKEERDKMGLTESDQALQQGGETVTIEGDKVRKGEEANELGDEERADEDREEEEYAEDEEDDEALLHIKKMEQSELIEGLKEKGENVYNRAVQHLPELFEFYIHICGPILHFDNLTNGIVELHLGNLIAKTEYPCAYSKFNLIFEFNETQITCLKTSAQSSTKSRKWKNFTDVKNNTVQPVDKGFLETNQTNEAKWKTESGTSIKEVYLKDSYYNHVKEKALGNDKFYILQPIPVMVYVEYDLKILKTNIILDGIFFQINPDAVSIILAVPTSITRYLTRFYSKNKKENELLKNKKKSSMEKKEMDSKGIGDDIYLNVSNMDKQNEKKTSDTNIFSVETTEQRLLTDEGKKIEKKEEESFLYDIDFLIKNSAFSIKNGKNCEILKYEACGISYKNYLQKKKKIVKVEIEQLWICDPSNRQPIFFTLTKNVNSKDIFLFRSLSTYLEERNNVGGGSHLLVGGDNNGVSNADNTGLKQVEVDAGKNTNNGNNGQGDIERFQSAQRIEEFMLSSSVDEGKESPGNINRVESHSEEYCRNERSPNTFNDQATIGTNSLKGNKVEECYSYERSKSRNSVSLKSSLDGASDRKEADSKRRGCANDGSSGRVCGESGRDDDDDDFMDAIEEKQLSINLQILQKHNEMNRAETHINFIISDIELHWKYKTIRQIFRTMKEYKTKLQYGIEKDMKYIKDKLQNEEELKNYKMFISEHTLRSVQETLKNVKNSLNILDIESAKKNNEMENIQEDVNANIISNSPLEDVNVVKSCMSDEDLKSINDVSKNYCHTRNGNKGDSILNNGLGNVLPKLRGQDNSYGKYFFYCYIKSASLAFWKKKKMFSKIQVSNIFYENKIYMNFDQKMFVNIEKGIISMNDRNIISNNISDYKYDLFLSKRNKHGITGVATGVAAGEAAEDANGAGGQSKDEKRECTKIISERKNSRDILNYINADNLSDEIRKKKKMTSKQKKQDLFIGKVKVYNDKRKYNICLLCDVSMIIPEDKNIIYNYKGEIKNTSECLKEGNNSYSSSTKLENNNIPYIESYLKFHLNTLKFKNAYTSNCTEQIMLQQRGEMGRGKKGKAAVRSSCGSGSGRGGGNETKGRKENRAEEAPYGEERDGVEKVENAESGESIEMTSSPVKYDFTLHVELLDMESRACENGGSTNIEGNILHKVNIGLCLISSKDGVFIYFNGNDLCLDLTVFQLAFLLDIINENFCYKGYFPMCFICDNNMNIDKLINGGWFRKGNLNFNNFHLKNDGNCQMDNTKGSMVNSINDHSKYGDNKEGDSMINDDINDACASSKPVDNGTKNESVRKNGLKLFVYINLDSLKIKTSFDRNTPVAIITFQTISISFHLVLLDFYYIYFFDLHSNSLYIDDVREKSINYYKRVAYCCIEDTVGKMRKVGKARKETSEKATIRGRGRRNPVGGGNIRSDLEKREDAVRDLVPAEGNNDNPRVDKNSSISNVCEENNNIYNLLKSNEFNEENCGKMKEKNFSKTAMNHYKDVLRYMFQNNVFLNEKKKKKKQKGIKIKINSFIEDILLSIELDDAYICFFFIIFIDIYKFLSTGFNLSTLHLYPKPSPYIVSRKVEGKKKRTKTGGYDHVKGDITIGNIKKFNLKGDKRKTYAEIDRYGAGENNMVEKHTSQKLHSGNLKKYDIGDVQIEEDVFKEERDQKEGEIRSDSHVELSPSVDYNKKDSVRRKRECKKRRNITNDERYIREKIKGDGYQVITNINELLKLDNKPIHINFKVNNGNFIIFTDLENIANPIIMWSNNFIFSFSLLNRCIIFRKIYAIDSKIKRMNYVSNIGHVKRINDTYSYSISNPLHNYHKKKILLCDNLNVKGEALYESVDAKKDNYIFRKNIRKNNFPDFISVFELDIYIGNFDIRLSNDDMEILLKASSTLFGDVPSSNTNIEVGPVIPPVTFLHRKIKNRFMRNNIFFITREVSEVDETREIHEANGGETDNTDDGVQIININKLRAWERRKKTRAALPKVTSGERETEREETIERLEGCELKEGTALDKCNEKEILHKREEGSVRVWSGSNNSNDMMGSYNAMYNLSSGSYAVSCSESPLSESPSSDSLSSESYLSDGVSVNRCAKGNESESVSTNTQVTTYRDIKISIKLNNVKCTFIDDIKNSIVPIIRMIFSMNLSLNFYTDECSYNINDLNSKIEYFNNCIGEWEPFLEKCNISVDVHRIIPNDMCSDDNESSKAPISIIKINSVKALWFNITPQLINLLLLFVPVFTEKVRNGLKKKDSKEDSLKGNYLENGQSGHIPNGENEKKGEIKDNEQKDEEHGAPSLLSGRESMSIELENKKLSVKSKSIYEDCSSVFDSLPGDNTDVMKSCDFHLDDFLKKEENRDSHICMKDNSVIYYVNLTSDYFYAFVMPEGNIDHRKKKLVSATVRSEYRNVSVEEKCARFDSNLKGSTSEVKIDQEEKAERETCTSDEFVKNIIPDVYAKIVATNELISLDELLINEIANNSLIEKKSLYLYLIPIPPTNVVNIIHDMFTGISKRDIVLDLMITKNPKKTIENLLSYNQSMGEEVKKKNIANVQLDERKSIYKHELSRCEKVENESSLSFSREKKKTYSSKEKRFGSSHNGSTTLGNECDVDEKTTDNRKSGASDQSVCNEGEAQASSDEEAESAGDSVCSIGSIGSIGGDSDCSDNSDCSTSSNERRVCGSYYLRYGVKGKQPSDSIFPPNKFIGPFLKNCECVIINLIKNSCTSLTTALKSSNVIHIIKPSDFIFQDEHICDDALFNSRISEKRKMGKGRNVCASSCDSKESILNEENIDKINKWEKLNEEMSKQTYLACKYRLKNNYLPQTSLVETVCEIISPLPNYKILFMSSTVRIVNKCGIPLEFCFFDGTKNPILLTSLENRTIPISTLYPNHSDSFKNYKVTNSLNINPNIKLRQKNNNLSFTIVLNHEHLLSTPECAFCGPSHVYLSFKPINLMNEENDYYAVCAPVSGNSKAKGEEDNVNKRDSSVIRDGGDGEVINPPDVSTENGWSDILSSDIIQGTYVKRCKFKNGNSYIYFLVKIEHKISALPAEKNIRIITIYPHVTVVNAIPALVDVIITSEMTEEKKNDYINDEKGKIDMLKNRKAKLLRQCEEINMYLRKVTQMKQSNSNTSGNDTILTKGIFNNERVYINELNKLEREIYNIEEEIKLKKKELSSSTLNKGYVNKRLNPFSIFYIYEIKKYTCLNMKVKIGNSQCEWSEKIYLVEDDDESVTRFSLHFKRFASVEIEIVKNFHAYFNSLSSILGNKQLYLFSLPRCFIDRTGLGIKAINSNKYYPIISGITLLGDSSHIDLLLPHRTCNNESVRSNRNTGRTYGTDSYLDYNDIFNDYNYPSPCDNSLILFKATLPPIGSYTETNVVCKNFFYTFCLNTEKIKTTNIPYIISRIITVVPQFIISNKLNYPLLIRQFQMDKIQGIRQNDTSPLYFTKKHGILLFQFRTMRQVLTGGIGISSGCSESSGSGYHKLGKQSFWSSVVFPSENFVGSNYMVMSSEEQDREKEESDVYVITCIPDMGTKNIVIEKLENSNKGYIAYNCSSLAKYFKIRTFHDDTNNFIVDGEEKHLERHAFFSNFLKSTDIEHYFNIEYNQYSYLGWVNPFIYVTRNIQIEVVLHDMHVLPKTPFVLKFAICNYSQKCYYIYYYNMTFIVSIEYIEDLISIKLTHRVNPTRGIYNSIVCSGYGGVLDMTCGAQSRGSLDMQTYNKVDTIDTYEVAMRDNSGIIRGSGGYDVQKKIIGQDEYNFVRHIAEGEGNGKQRGNNYNNYHHERGRSDYVKVVSNMYKNVHIIINVTQIGVSIISSLLKEEVFFIELSKLFALFYMKNEEEIIDLKITDVQIDCQLESCEKCVLLANRGINSSTMKGGSSSSGGGGGRSGNGNNGSPSLSRNQGKRGKEEQELKRINNKYEEKSSGISSYINGTGNYLNELNERNRINGGEEKIFLNVYVERSFISHNDVIFKKIKILMDDLEIEMDAETLNGINFLMAEYIEGISIVQKKNILYEEIQKWTILPVYVNYKSPEIPLAINIQYMEIDKFTLIVWCSFLLDKMHMMSDLLRIGLRILMVSGKLELLGAPVTLNKEVFNNIRVSIKSFSALLKDKYSHSILACLGFIVGYSSLINIPKIPLEIGRNTIGLAVYAVDNVSVGIGSFLSNLTFDSEYINRRQKERNFKTNTNMKEGLLSAVKNIGEGVLSLSNIVTKPIEGAQKEGVGGFFKGIGKGVAGSLVKPLDKVGQAVSDVTRGIKAEVSKPIGGYKYKTKRHRKPRMLWGEYGKIKEYNINEAELRECLGLKFSKNIMKCVTIHRQENHPPAHYALLLYPKVIIYANLYASACGNTYYGSTNGEFLGDKRGDIVIWSVKIEDITEIRASSHGLIIRTTSTNNLVYKIPCNNALLINKIYRELQNSRSSINSTIALGATR
ncbi:conserved Plasmodium protein, unknown function [Plasmodium ovale curtisi]|uniref:Chorein N-terminal domain-containing protein n=1 Tax=Plasmodium ovale curtisi TaxID=864141 RepID=A0A1A8WXJ6_PLAOA|nr:conserved Plasmodium protein, unknown function [Plasmodium ovale curtisi]